MLDLFRQAMNSALALLGGGALLRGSVPCQVHIEYGVQLAGLDGTAVVERDVATIAIEHNPRVGDSFTFTPGAPYTGTYKLDALLGDNGATKRFIILKTAP